MVGMVLLGIYLILIGLGHLGVLSAPGIVLGILAIVAGILIIAGR